ncbi:MAG: hypothetical protein K0U41_02065 [Gammaproteobacteria bacterium]|nr:hypothetical protein [Gammaproteobacteria bacterium]
MPPKGHMSRRNRVLRGLIIQAFADGDFHLNSFTKIAYQLSVKMAEKGFKKPVTTDIVKSVLKGTGLSVMRTRQAHIRNIILAELKRNNQASYKAIYRAIVDAGWVITYSNACALIKVLRPKPKGKWSTESKILLKSYKKCLQRLNSDGIKPTYKRVAFGIEEDIGCFITLYTYTKIKQAILNGA